MEKGASGVITTVAAYVAAQPLASRRVLRLFARPSGAPCPVPRSPSPTGFPPTRCGASP